MRTPTGTRPTKKQAEETIKAVKNVGKKIGSGVKKVSSAVKNKVLKAFKK